MVFQTQTKQAHAGFFYGERNPELERTYSPGEGDLLRGGRQRKIVDEKGVFFLSRIVR